MNVLVKKAHIIIYYTDILKGVLYWFAISSVLFLQVKTFFFPESGSPDFCRGAQHRISYDSRGVYGKMCGQRKVWTNTV